MSEMWKYRADMLFGVKMTPFDKVVKTPRLPTTKEWFTEFTISDFICIGMARYQGMTLKEYFGNSYMKTRYTCNHLLNIGAMTA